MRGSRASTRSCWCEGLLAELAQGVKAALEQFARDRETGAVATKPLGGLKVILVVRRGAPPRALRGLKQRPPQRGGSLTGEMTRRAALIGRVDGDV
jgi:hypothetical protein